MTLPLHDPKALRTYLPLDGAPRPRLLRRLRSWLCWAAVVGCLALVLALGATQEQTVFQAGAVSSPHAMFQHDCQACHQEPFRKVEQFWQPTQTIHSVADRNCLQCHAAPRHNHLAGSDNCASCHREHRGARMLTHVPDQQCTACHADLEQGRFAGKTRLRNVTAFADGKHPPFDGWQERRDPGTIRFNHAVHLVPEGVLDLDVKQAGDALPAPRSRRVLQCNSCHQLEADERYMKPIRYAQHCQSCHPLSIRLHGTEPHAALASATTAFAKRPAPHTAPVSVRAELRERLQQFWQEHSAELHAPQAAEPEVPHLLPTRAGRPSSGKEGWQWSERQLNQQEHTLFRGQGGCVYCHRQQPGGWDEATRLPSFAATQINERFFDERIGTSNRWLPRSRFRHHAHRMLQCTDCHAAPRSTQTGEVLLPTMQKCLECHNPTQGARTDCVHCHAFHAHARHSPWKLGVGKEGE